MNTFDSFVYRTLNTESVQVVKHEPTKLDSLIGWFLYSIRKADESEFEFYTLTLYHWGIDRYLLENNYQHSNITNRQFQNSRNILTSHRKDLKEKGNRGTQQSQPPYHLGGEYLKGKWYNWNTWCALFVDFNVVKIYRTFRYAPSYCKSQFNVGRCATQNWWKQQWITWIF